MLYALHCGLLLGAQYSQRAMCVITVIPCLSLLVCVFCAVSVREL